MANNENCISLENRDVSDTELYYSPSTSKHSISKLNLAIVFGLCLLFIIIIIFGVGLVLSVSIPVCLSESSSGSDNDEIEYGDHSAELIVTTTEFQITLENLGDSEWDDRASMMKTWMQYFEKSSDYFTLEESTMQNQSKNQFYVDIDDCGSSHLIRVRNIVDGYMENLSTIDIKGNSQSESKAAALPFWPAPKYLGNSTQKCERDEHVCDHKYSRETRVTLDYFKSFEYCVDIVELFPYAFGNLPATSLVIPIAPGKEEAWFEQLYTGYLDGNTRYKVAFTIKYDNIDDAIDNHHPKSGEWSIRLYSLGDGASSEYNEDVKQDISQAWKALIDKYSTETC